MSYRIEYAPSGCIRQERQHGWLRKAALTAAFLVISLFLTKNFWPEGAAVLDRLCSYDDWRVTRQALETMAGQLRSGLPVGEAVTAFCREVVSQGLTYAG